MKALIAAYARSPQTFARKGPLASVRPDTMAAQVVTGLLERLPDLKLISQRSAYPHIDIEACTPMFCRYSMWMGETLRSVA